MKTHAFVFARGGSKGIPKKNLLSIGGIPLLARSIRTAQRITEIERVFVSTDDTEIAETARNYGAEIITRPPELAQDDSPEWLAWQHAVSWVIRYHGEFSRFVSIPTTAPLRSDEDVLACLEALTPDWDLVMTMTPSTRSPWFNIVTEEPGGKLRLVANQYDGVFRRQDVPSTYDLTTVAYTAWTAHILGRNSIWSGKVRGVKVPPERALDIDNEYDLQIARWLLESRNSMD